MISVDCDLQLELEGSLFRITRDQLRHNQLILDIPSLDAGLKLARQVSSPPLRALLWSLQETGWLEQVQLALRYRNIELINQSLQSFARLDTLWKLSNAWKSAFRFESDTPG